MPGKILTLPGGRQEPDERIPMATRICSGTRAIAIFCPCTPVIIEKPKPRKQRMPGTMLWSICSWRTRQPSRDSFVAIYLRTRLPKTCCNKAFSRPSGIQAKWPTWKNPPHGSIASFAIRSSTFTAPERLKGARTMPFFKTWRSSVKKAIPHPIPN